MSAPFLFDGRTAVITGAASGIGAALAADLASRGCHLALVDINAEGLEAVAQPLRSNDRRLTTHVVDLGDGDQIKALADQIKAEHGEAHLLFNNAGVALGGTFDRVTEENFEWLFDINFWGVVRMTRALMPLMEEADEGRIINISSIFGVIAPPGQTAYSAAKFAVRGFSDSLRHELDGSRIGVTTVHPGGVNTNIAASARPPQDATEEEIEQGRKMAARTLVMPPPRAAEIILRGVERRRPRVLVGRDAHIIALIERLLPYKYWKIMERHIGTGVEETA